MRSYLTAVIAAAALLWLASAPWYQHLSWLQLAAAVVLAALVLGGVALGVTATVTAGRSSRKQQED